MFDEVRMAKSLEDVVAELGWHELKPLPSEQRNSLIAELLLDPEIRVRAEAFAFKGATMDTLSTVVEAALLKKEIHLDGLQFFNLVTQMGQQVSDRK
ncbi:MAG: hypothetical protein K2Y40_18905 [Reyranella sp.]|nr:hypothetical protein [Reyranella sp.]